MLNAAFVIGGIFEKILEQSRQLTCRITRYIPRHDVHILGQIKGLPAKCLDFSLGSGRGGYIAHDTYIGGFHFYTKVTTVHV